MRILYEVRVHFGWFSLLLLQTVHTGDKILPNVLCSTGGTTSKSISKFTKPVDGFDLVLLLGTAVENCSRGQVSESSSIPSVGPFYLVSISRVLTVFV